MKIKRVRGLQIGAVAFLILAISSLVTYLGLFSSRATPPGSEWQRRYWAAVFSADKASDAEDWPEAARSYGKITELLPHDPVARFNRALALARLDRVAESCEELRLAVEYGWANIDRLRSDPAFGKVRSTPGFGELLSRASQIADESTVIFVPQGLDENVPAPLIITFHGMGQNPHSHIQSWKQAAGQLGAVVVAPRGIQRIGGYDNAHSFRWGTKGGGESRDRLVPFRALLQQSIEFAGHRALIDKDRVVLAGYSQGGSVAMALLADSPERTCGVVVEATSYWSDTLKKWQQPRSDGHEVRAYFLVHEFDRMRRAGKAAYHAFQNAGIDARLKIIPGADHELPLDHGSRLVEAMRFVLRLNPAGP